MSNVIQFPIGETQRNTQRKASEQFANGLRGSFPSAKIIPFALVNGAAAIVADIAQA